MQYDILCTVADGFRSCYTMPTDKNRAAAGADGGSI